MAGIPLSQGIDYSGTMPNFQRDYYKTLAALKEAGSNANKGTMPPMLLGLCKEDGKVYLYDKINNEEDTENGFGYWREFKTGASSGGAENNKTSFPINFINYYHNGKIGEIDRETVDPQCYRDYESFDLFALAIKKELTKVKYNLLRPRGIGGNPVEEITLVKRYTGDVYDREGHTLLADDDFNYKKYLRIEFNNDYYVVIDTEEKSIAGFYGAFAIAREEASSSCECEEETDTIDFSTWPEFTAPEATGTYLDGNGGLVIGDDSNIGVDPDDIEPDD